MLQTFLMLPGFVKSVSQRRDELLPDKTFKECDRDPVNIGISSVALFFFLMVLLLVFLLDIHRIVEHVHLAIANVKSAFFGRSKKYK